MLTMLTMLTHASLTDIPCLTAWKGNSAMLTTIGLVQLKKKFIKIPLSTLFFKFLKIYTGTSEKFYIIFNNFFLILQKMFHFTSESSLNSQ